MDLFPNQPHSPPFKGGVAAPLIKDPFLSGADGVVTKGSRSRLIALPARSFSLSKPKTYFTELRKGIRQALREIRLAPESHKPDLFSNEMVKLHG